LVGKGGNVHSAEGDVNGGAAHFDGDDGIEDTHGGLKGLQEAVLVREHAVLPGLDTKADACMDVLCGGLEPSVTLSLLERRIS
jgi:hypothetical protein